MHSLCCVHYTKSSQQTIKMMAVKQLAGIVILGLFVTWGCSSGDQGSDNNQQSPQQEQQSSSGEADQYGREPGHQHYGHDHPPQGQQQNNQGQSQQPQSGEADQHGREPGHEHYGHDHPPMDEQ